jgi:hypothetical protein
VHEERNEEYVAEEGEVALLTFTLGRRGVNLTIHKPNNFPLKAYAQLIAGVVSQLAGAYEVEEQELWDAIEEARDNLDVRPEQLTQN